MGGRLHVVGAGVAGLSAALAAARRGWSVRLHEAARQAGGRCRTVTPPDGFAHDNGTHVLLTANWRALAFLDGIDARGLWIEPEPDGLPVYDARNGRLRHVGLSPWSWWSASRRPEGLGLADLPRLMRLALPLPDRSIAAVIGGRPVMDSLVEPLTVAVLNTPVEVASARRLGRALQRVVLPGAARLLVASRGLSPDLIEPALAALARLGAHIDTGARLRTVEHDGSRATALAFADRVEPLGGEEKVVLALPPWEIGRLLPQAGAPQDFEPILNAHFRVRGPARPRFIGLRGALSQWALARADHVSVTVSAAGEAIDEPPDALGRRIWAEVAPALAAAGVPIATEGEPEARIVKEKRATIRQAAGAPALPPLRPLANLSLAGDWLSPLPATIESAIASGEAAVRALTGGLRLPTWKPAGMRASSLPREMP